MNKRLYVETHTNYEVEKIEALIERHLGQSITGTRKLSVFDFIQTDENTFNNFYENVLKDELVHSIYETVELGDVYIAYEAVGGQYDQASEWAQVLLKNDDVRVEVSELIIFKEQVDLKAVRRLLVNPLEFQDKDLAVFNVNPLDEVTPMQVYNDFIELDESALRTFYNEHGFAMEYEDIQYVQDYFINEKRNPTETELLVLDTYWSDHCRHTTFMTEIQEVEFESFPLKDAIEASFKHYLKDKAELGRAHKPLSLMDITAQNGRYAKNVLKDDIIEVSEEVNACSIRINVDVDGVDEPWLLMFKNETHNHPTEIEPYGGASTCIGGAIRDPLSGRAYVYQAMRITGSGNVLETLSETRVDKLPQAFIAEQASAGYSHYADQIGVSSSYVKEIFHDSYRAKRMECGAVVGAIKESDLIRQSPVTGDVVVMMGGRTGRDGVGGATGSSDIQTTESTVTNAAEVQKGNALEERKIMRLFRDPKISSIIKKSNDFGAGGVSVAIGELADGLLIDLDSVKLKYPGLNPTEVAISESQERMAVVLDPKHVQFFLDKAAAENVEAVVVAEVNDTHRLVIKDANGTYVDLDRTFVDSGGITQKTNALIKNTDVENPLMSYYEINEANILADLQTIQNASQAGLAQRFNAHGALIKPLLGKHQLTPNIGSVESLPILKGTTNTVSMLTHGFIPSVNEYSPYVGGALAVVESLSKTVAMGGDFRKVYFSFQEYFNRLTSSDRWGRVMQALLGTYEAQKQFGLCAIGGKDSMSGSYEGVDVVDTLVSFACSPQKKDLLISSELKSTDSYLYLMDAPIDELGLVDYEALMNQYDAYYALAQDKTILSAMTTDDASIIVTLTKMAMGNHIGFDVALNAEHTSIRPGSIVFETQTEVEGFTFLGKTQVDETANINSVSIALDTLVKANTSVLSPVYPVDGFKVEDAKPVVDNVVSDNTVASGGSVLIPVFEGTVGEYDLIEAFNFYDANVNVFVYSNNPKEFAAAISKADIVAFADGAVNGDVPVLGAFAVEVLRDADVKEALENHINNKKRVLGFGNGFQILVKSGLIPFDKVTQPAYSFAQNNTGRRVCMDVVVQSAQRNLWTANLSEDTVYHAQTHGQVVGDLKAEHIVYQYAGLNPNGSTQGVEALVSDSGLVFGRMGNVNDAIIKNALSGLHNE